MAWLGNWKQRIKLTVDSSIIDSNLTHYPVMVKIENSVVFTELGTNDKKIAFTKSDSTTQLYAEIELWDNTNNLAVLHVSKSDWVISSSSDTVFYMYFDSSKSDNTTYIGDIASATNVYDSNFVMVQHMGTSLLDSTSNSNDGTNYGSTVVDGLNGKGRLIEINEHIDWGSNLLGTSGTSIFSITSVSKFDNVSDDEGWIVQQYEAGNVDRFIYGYDYNADSGEQWYFVGGTSYHANIIPTENTWNHMALTHATNGYSEFFLQGSNNGSFSTTHNLANVNTKSGATISYDGVLTIDEVRISNIARSNAWIKADDYNLRQNTLITQTYQSYIPDYKYKREIVIDHTKVDSTLTDYPVMVKLDDSNFNFDEIENPNGYDIVFKKDNIQLNHELELFIDAMETISTNNYTINPTVDKAYGTMFFEDYEETRKYYPDISSSHSTNYTRGNYEGAKCLSNYIWNDSGVARIQHNEGNHPKSTAVSKIYSGTNLYTLNNNIIGERWVEMFNSGGSYTTSCYLGNIQFRVNGTLKTLETMVNDGDISSVVLLGSESWDIQYMWSNVRNWYSGGNCESRSFPHGYITFRTNAHVTIDAIQMYANRSFDLQYADGFRVNSWSPAEGELYTDRAPVLHRESVFHVKLPVISNTEDTIFEMHYGDSSITTNQSDSINTWDEHFVMIQHMGDSLVDSSGNGNDGTNYGSTVVDGLNGNARSFDGVDDMIKNTSPNGFSSGNNPFTITALINANSAETHKMGIASYGTFGATDNSNSFALYDFSNASHPKKLNHYFWANDIWGTFDFVYNEYAIASVTFNSINRQIYINSTPTSSDTTTANVIVDNLQIGKTYNDEFFNGTIDEVRISNIARSDAWIKADDYNLRTNTLIIIGKKIVDILDYEYQRRLTIDHTKVDSTLTDYPVMVKLDENNFDFTKFKNANGYDLIFEQGGYQLDHEVELFEKGKETSTLYLYNNGDENISLTGGISYSVLTAGGGLTKQTSYLEIYSPEWSDGNLVTINNIHFENYDELNIEYTIYGSLNDYAAFRGCCSTDTTIISTGNIIKPSIAVITLDDASFTNLSCYISNLASNSTTKLRISRIWLTSYAILPQALYHVKIPTISSTANTTFNMFYGNENILTDQSNKNSTWDEHFVMIQHMGDSLVDSSGNGNDLINSGTVVINGLNGKARSIGIDSDKLYNASLNLGSDPIFTIQNIFKPLESVSGMGLWGLGSENNAISSYVSPNGTSNSMSFDEWGSTSLTSNGIFNTSNYYLGSWVKHGSGLFKDSILDAFLNNTKTTLSYARDGNVTANVTAGFSIGNIAYNAPIQYNTSSIIDEVRISNISRSDAWIKADDYNLRLATLLSVGSEELAGQITLMLGFNF